jgi:hypothetical protein
MNYFNKAAVLGVVSVLSLGQSVSAMEMATGTTLMKDDKMATGTMMMKDDKMMMKGGATMNDISMLQTFLISQKFLNISTPTGKLGPKTRVALMKYQKSVGLPMTGNYGPKTRAMVKGGMMMKDGDMMKGEKMMMKDHMMATGTMMMKDEKMATGTMMKDSKMTQ